MMSILIRGMEMPKGCLLCRFFDPIHEVCLGMERAEKTILSDKYKHPACPLIEVPTPHGDLIDKNALTHEYYKKASYSHLCDCLNNAPTIIESEGV